MTAATENRPATRARALDGTGHPDRVTPEEFAALIRVVQATAHYVGTLIGKNDLAPNATLVRMGAAREDVEMLRAFLASRPRPAHIPAEET